MALIPARGGSKRVPGKNMRLLAGHPLIAYTIAAAKQSGVCDRIVVSTEDAATRAYAESIEDVVVHPRKAEHATDEAPDVLWVRDAMAWLKHWGMAYDAFAILRPTSPFRTANTIRRAWGEFTENTVADSIRAVERWTGFHPGKMWVFHARWYSIAPVSAGWTEHAPYHSSPTQILPPIYRQTAGLEMAWSRVLSGTPTIAGSRVSPFFTMVPESVDINTEEDFARAEQLAREHPELLPPL